MSQDVEKVLYNKLENKSFTIQVDESTDFTNKHHSVAFVIFVNGDEFYRNFPCAKSGLKQAKGDMSLMFDLHVSNRSSVCEEYIGICTEVPCR